MRQFITHLRSSLDQVAAEEELLEVIADGLAALRRSYPSHRSSFTPGDVEFLKSLGRVSDDLRAFIDLREESATVSSLAEYEDIMNRLTRAKNSLACFAVSRRIAKEIRALLERLPAIREQDEAQRQRRVNARVIEVEQQKPRRCPRGHPMVIREAGQAYFWGCSRYPQCCAKARLTPEENDVLTG